MNRWCATLCRGLFFSAIFFSAAALSGQDGGGSLSGTVTDSFGNALPNITVSVKNVATGQTAEAQTDVAGHYTVSNLPVGDYEVSAPDAGSPAAPVKVTVTSTGTQTANLTLQPATPQPSAPPASLPDAPSSAQAGSSSGQSSSAPTAGPSLEDLGFSKADQQGDAKQQALLDKRTHMLKIHQRMGLITTIPLIASVITSFGAGGHDTSTASRDLHVALGSVTGDLYGITAWYAIRAPRIKGAPPKRGPIRFHEAMAWIHGPGMILTPILGAIAFDQKSNGEKVHGIASAHGPVAIVTAGAFGAALISVSFKF
jgi:hypothetical protein